MPLIFSYGTLQDERVQLEQIGRRLDGSRDELIGFEVVPRGPYTTVKRNAASRVSGTCYEITDEELAAFDIYEGDDYGRIEVRLASGRVAWVYLVTSE